MDTIDRVQYIEKIKNYLNKNLIKVFIGQRRVGKSYLIKLTIQYILKKNPDSNIIYIDKELYDFDHINTYQNLITYIEELLDSTKENYIFIDEVQEIEAFEKALRHFQNQNKADIYISGSNAEMLSGDLASMLSGRYVQIQINSLSYIEFLTFHNLDDNDESLYKYLKWGGLPYIKNLQKDDVVIFDYLSNILSTILFKDVIARYKIRNIDFFERLVLYMASNSGNLITSKKISDYLKSQKVDISAKVVLSYMQCLQNAFLIYKLNRVDIHSKKVFEINNKYYFEDWGLRNALVGLNHYSVPDILENVVFSHLKTLGYQVSVGVMKDLEIDFIAEKGGKKLYIQVAYLIPDEKVKLREFGNLLLIKDNYPKYVVSLDPVQIGQYKGVEHLHLRAFLKKDFNI
ncbi:ATP-binding protein [Plebeiibacterium marinum]|uniref:ATP-binding protein n=1 Tax=Plebeiibacterium marinum TaxID=2992111 RepID=A0AAE3MHF5_9BACT|nr:ATP-binding protein [Plebeiobacterium marinum]MCW3808038.1 ATP-binding protein [Plebeiobacterium marinum]